MSNNIRGVEEVGIKPWENVRYKWCEHCKIRREYCFYIKGQWLCMICRIELYGKKKLIPYKAKVRKGSK